MGTSSRITLEPGWILHRRPYRETSQLLDALTLNHGMVGLVARGARREKSRVSTEPFQQLMLSWSGRGELKTLTGAESGTVPMALGGRRLWSGMYANELLVRLLQRGDPCPELYQEYCLLIEQLAGHTHEQDILRRFERRLLDHLGYGLVLDLDAREGRPLSAGQHYEYLVESGALPCEMGHTNHGGFPISGAALLALAEDRLDDDELRREAKLFMRHVLRHYLGERPLNAGKLFRRW